MKTPPHRIALVASILLVLAGVGMWWWSHSTEEGATPPDKSALASAEQVPTRLPRLSSAPRSGNSAGAPSSDCGIAIRDAFNVRARDLVQRDDASSLLAYALAVPFDTPVNIDRMDPVALQGLMEKRSADRQRALMRAAELAPDKPEILFMAATQCSDGGDACRGVQRALLAAAPDNLAVWLYEMGWASVRNDPDASGRAFERAAKATRDDRYAHSALQVLVEAYGGMPMPEECSGEQAKTAMRRETGMDHDFSMLDQALLIASATRAGSLPAYNIIRMRCMPKPGKVMGAETRVGCRNILTRIADGDTLIDRAIGLGTMVQLVADGPDASAWRQRYREFRWMYAQQFGSETYRSLQAEDYWIDEVGAMQAALQAAGRWPPPANWQPDDDYSRSLIQTGRPPPHRTP